MPPWRGGSRTRRTSLSPAARRANDRFRARAALKPVVNVTSEELTSDQYLAAPEEFGLMPCMVGEEDRRTPASESLQLYDALQLRAAPTALVLVPGASHEGLAERPSQFAAETAIILDWFRRHDDTAEKR